MRQPEPPRMIDVRIDWLVQYAPETTLFGPESVAIAGRDLPRIEGYLGATSAAFIALGHPPKTWAILPDPWGSIDGLLTRTAAEFSGRMLQGTEDLKRWKDDPQGLTWAVVELAGLSALVRSTDDLNRLPVLFERGVRVFQPGAISSERVPPLIEVLSNLSGGRASLDLAGLSPDGLQVALDWYDADPGRVRRLPPIRSFGGIDDVARRVRDLGGLVGLGVSSRAFESAESLRLAVEELGDRVALATDIFGGGSGLSGLETVPQIQEWALKSFGEGRGRAILRGNAESWIDSLIGG